MRIAWHANLPTDLVCMGALCNGDLYVRSTMELALQTTEVSCLRLMLRQACSAHVTTALPWRVRSSVNERVIEMKLWMEKSLFVARI
jgi:TfoX/Sxy family transcriptional regulator of competence genes